MAETSSDWANGPGPEVALSSDEEDFVSSESTASAEQEALTKHQLPSKLARLNLAVESSESSDKSVTRTQTSTPATAASIRTEERTPTTKKPLQLLELPLDVLKDIIKEVTHTNDLTSLALTCSVMHALTVPHMYSRFDIVWPESLTPTSEEYAGVDALSYGLSTLVMGEDVYQHAPAAQCRGLDTNCAHCGCSDHGYHTVSQSSGGISRALARRGNNYAQFTRTFSIGNGPLSWVQEYSVNREVGKMLGTLVALAASRMINLETFIWDMPTGVVREIWLALASLADRTDGKCRLGRVWVRWHDNSDNALRIPTTVPASGTRLLQKYRHVEYPSLSVLPPLKSVTVLDIDESAYVEELGVLIERSRHCLLELRIGISMKARAANWLTCAKDVQAPTNALSSWPRVGGILSILSKQDPQPQPEESTTPGSTSQSSQPSSTEDDKTGGNPSRHTPTSPLAENEDLTKEPHDEKSPPPVASVPCPSKSSGPLYSSQAHPDKLNLEVLELERIPLSIPHLLPMIDWTRLTTLTIMGCREHENLWRALRRKYAPPPMPQKRVQPGERRRSSLSAQDYPLNIKHLRTDTVTPFLMLFIKDALAPNTLESVYLHESPDYESNVNVEAIYRHIIRKHRLSLTKMLFDASDRMRSSDNLSTEWHKWMFNHEMVSFVTSGRMPQLKELGMALHYRDWHYFLQRLPKIPQLRALYLPHISHCVHREMKELASSVLDIVSIRPDLKITYIGLHTKCYQILERTGSGTDFDTDTSQSTNSSVHPGDDGLSGFDEDALDTDDDDTGEVNQDLLDYSDDSDDSVGGNEESTSSSVHFRLQEILFYDDKISIFKMRHGVI